MANASALGISSFTLHPPTTRQTARNALAVCSGTKHPRSASLMAGGKSVPANAPDRPEDRSLPWAIFRLPKSVIHGLMNFIFAFERRPCPRVAYSPRETHAPGNSRKRRTLRRVGKCGSSIAPLRGRSWLTAADFPWPVRLLSLACGSQTSGDQIRSDEISTLDHALEMGSDGFDQPAVFRVHQQTSGTFRVESIDTRCDAPGFSFIKNDRSQAQPHCGGNHRSLTRVQFREEQTVLLVLAGMNACLDQNFHELVTVG
jgi:hypothetical protein